MNRFIVRWRMGLLSLASFIFISSIILSAPFLKEPLELCKISTLRVSIDDGQQNEVKFPVEKPIEVKPGVSIIVTTEIETKPEVCEGFFYVDWRLLFESGPPKVETISESPMQGVFKVTFETQTSDDVIVLTVRDTSGAIKERKSIPLKVKGE